MEKLRERILAARDEYLRISAALDKLTREEPSADGVQALLKLGTRRDAAFVRYIKLLTQVTPHSGGTPSMTPLSSREREVLALIASGKSSREIAATLGIAFRTVVTHRCHLYKKVQAHKATDVTRVAARMGLIESS